QNDVTLKMPAFEWVHVQLHQQKGMISLSPPTICNSARKNQTGSRNWQLIYQDRRNLSKHKQMMLPVLSTISVTGGITAPHLAALALQLERIKTMVEFKKNSWG
ncbi:hypothetical protein ACSNMQ_28770, partial [Klebsiella pneumoniae]|uniref:hypothetical protein n=1 Tax=Klebsiella pneumoniae TaxID=573 RepID=UPI00190FA53C